MLSNQYVSLYYIFYIDRKYSFNLNYSLVLKTSTYVLHPTIWVKKNGAGQLLFPADLPGVLVNRTTGLIPSSWVLLWTGPGGWSCLPGCSGERDDGASPVYLVIPGPVRVVHGPVTALRDTLGENGRSPWELPRGTDTIQTLNQLMFLSSVSYIFQMVWKIHRSFC